MSNSFKRTEDLHKEIKNLLTLSQEYLTIGKIIPDNPHHDWVNRRDEADDEFKKYMPIGGKKINIDPM